MVQQALSSIFSWQGLVVMIFMVIIDICWANYNMRSAEKKPGAAAFWSMAIIFAGTLSTQIWLENHWVIFNDAVGAYLGTYWAIWRAKEKERATPAIPVHDYDDVGV